MHDRVDGDGELLATVPALQNTGAGRIALKADGIVADAVRTLGTVRPPDIFDHGAGLIFGEPGQFQRCRHVDFPNTPRIKGVVERFVNRIVPIPLSSSS